MDSAKIVIVMLRRPRMDDPNEMRTDPFWEFGSFGCTGCHRKNLMNPKKLFEHTDARFAFAQNGHLGVKLVHLTPPLKMRNHGGCGEATWQPAEMPLRYDTAPTLINNVGFSDVPSLLSMIEGVRRGTPVAQFSSKFRSRRRPLPDHIGREVSEVFERFRNEGAQQAETYVDALPHPPPRVDSDRVVTYRRLSERWL